MKRFMIINGPNLNLLSKREPELYGTRSFDDYLPELRSYFPSVQIDYYQSNHEGDIIDKIHEVGFSYDGIILNAAAYTHTSLAIAEAVKAVTTPTVEVHISDLTLRESFRQHSYLRPVCVHTIGGLGLDSYRYAIISLLENDASIPAADSGAPNR